ISRSHLAPVKNAASIAAIAAGGQHSILFKPFTDVLVTGLNNHGQLGLGHLRTQYTPTGMGRLDTHNYVAVATGSSHGMHSLVLLANGLVMACGKNDYGQLGNGTFTDSPLPALVKGPGGVGYLSNIIAIAAGDDHSLALGANGIVYAWGCNDHG